ncbi:MAG: rod shape-determining protein RodA [Proteobacteria bacterium]|nr:MAG: rod shape-determining protein RodA [Pseudomonadota bacterium]
MARIERRLAQHYEWWLVGLIVLLIGLGLANLMSATHPESEALVSPTVRRQLAALALGAIGFTGAVAIDYRHLERWAPFLYAATLLLLGVTLALAPVTRGNQSWLVFGPIRLQPSELARVGMVVMLARWFHRNAPGEVRRLRDLLQPGLIAAGTVGLIILQRDMGVAILTLAVACTYLLFVRIPLRSWAAVAGTAVAILAVVWLFALAPYQKSRILDVVDPARDPLASGYQANQSRIAIGSGGLFGKGYMEGTQTQLRFLPTQHTDFIFSVLAEEWGMVGAATVLTLYLSLLIWGLFIARGSKDLFGSLLAVGVVGMLFWPAVVNVLMVVGLAPVIGVPLPLFSYGGSSLLATMTALGLLLNVSLRRYMF